MILKWVTKLARFSSKGMARHALTTNNFIQDNNIVEMVWHNHKLVQLNIRSYLACIYPFFISNFSEFIQMCLSIPNLAKH